MRKSERDQPGRSETATLLRARGTDRIAIHGHRVTLVAEESVVASRTRLPNMLRGTFEVSFVTPIRYDGRRARRTGD